MACTFCYNVVLKEDEIGTLDLEKFTSAINSLSADSDFSAVNLNGLGESLLIKDFPSYVAAAKKAGVVDIMFHTNASIMNESIAHQILDSGVDKVIFSVDSPEKESYESMRLQKSNKEGFPIERINHNVHTFKDVRDSHENHAMIRCTMVLTDVTKDQVDTFISKWDNVADILTVQDLTWRDNDYYDWKNGETSPKNLSLEEIKEKLVSSGSKWSCPYVYQSLFLHQDGSYAPCSNPYARKELKMGHVDQETPIEVWNNARYTELRSVHNRGEWYTHPTCSKCEIAIIEALKASQFSEAAEFASVDE